MKFKICSSILNLALLGVKGLSQGPGGEIVWAGAAVMWVVTQHLSLLSWLSVSTLFVILQMILEPKEDEVSVAWKAVEQFYRFGVGSVAGGEFCCILLNFISITLLGG